MTFSIPSAPQNLFCAKGKSLETHNTVVFKRSAAILLKLRTDAAQVPVSILGNMFNTKFFPLKSPSVFTDKSPAINLKSAAILPIAGNTPLVLIAFPFNVIFDIFFRFN